MPPCPAIIFRGPRVPNEAERLELGHPPTASTSYLIRLQRDTNSAVIAGERLQTGTASNNEYIKIEDGIPTQDLTRDNNLLAVITYEPDGSVFLQSVCSSPATILHITGGPHITPRVSTPEREHLYALIADSSIKFEGFDDHTLLFRYRSNRAPHIPWPTQLPTDTSMDLKPASIIDESMIANTPMEPSLQGVLETPARDSRHLDPSSSQRARRIDESPSRRRTTLPPKLSTANLVHPVNTGTAQSQDDMEEISVEDLDGIMATPGTEIPFKPAPIADMGLTAPTPDLPEPGIQQDRSPEQTSLSVDKPAEKNSPKKPHHHHHGISMADVDETGECDVPESLPEAFHYEAHKKLHTPVKTYGRKKKGMSDSNITIAETPGVRTTANSKKRKSPDEGPETATKKRKATPASETADSEDDAPATITKAKHRRPRSLDRVDTMNTSDDESDFAREQSPSIDFGKKGRIMSEAEVRTAGRAVAKGKAASSLGDTQYTFPDDSAEEDGTRVHTKTPRSRGKTGTTKKTPASEKKTAKSARKKVATPPVGGPSDYRTAKKYDGPAPRIAFSGSTLSTSKATISFIRANSGKTVSSPSDPACNFLVTTSELKRTPKLIVAVVRGIDIVEEQWLIDSHSAGHLLDPDRYVLNDTEREADWDFSLAEAIERGKNGQNNVLDGLTVYLTASLLAQLKASGNEGGLVEMLNAAGAAQIVKKAPRHEPEEGERGIVLAKEEGESISTLEEQGWEVFTPSVVGMSVFRGAFQDGPEFRAKHSGEASPPKKRGAKR